MKISTKGRYALRLMIDVAIHQKEGYVALRDAAQRQGISVKYLEQIAGMLSKAGMLLSGRGPRADTGWPRSRRRTRWAVSCG